MSNDLALLRFFEISAESVRYRGEFEKRMEKLLKELTGLREEVDSKTGFAWEFWVVSFRYVGST